MWPSSLLAMLVLFITDELDALSAPPMLPLGLSHWVSKSLWYWGGGESSGVCWVPLSSDCGEVAGPLAPTVPFELGSLVGSSQA